jgi:hypothetical protein
VWEGWELGDFVEGGRRLRMPIVVWLGGGTVGWMMELRGWGVGGTKLFAEEGEGEVGDWEWRGS